MAKDDYFVVVFKLLNYYYQCMKHGKSINENDISAFVLGINENYLLDIYQNLFDDGYLVGTKIVEDFSGRIYLDNINRIRITTKGVEYLENNDTMKKIYRALKEFKTWIPGM